MKPRITTEYSEYWRDNTDQMPKLLGKKSPTIVPNNATLGQGVVREFIIVKARKPQIWRKVNAHAGSLKLWHLREQTFYLDCLRLL